MLHIRSLHLFVVRKEKNPGVNGGNQKRFQDLFGYSAQTDIWRCQSSCYLSKSLVGLSNKAFLTQLMKEQLADDVKDDRGSISV